MTGNRYILRLVLNVLILMISGFCWSSTWAQVEKDAGDRIARYKADKSIDFANWPEQGKLIIHPSDLSNTIAKFSGKAVYLKDHKLSEIDGIKYERTTYRTWQARDGQQEELSVWVTSMGSVTNAHEYLLSRWANVSAPYQTHTQGHAVGLDVGDICFVMTNRVGGIHVAWFIRANVVIEIRAGGSFMTQVSDLARAIDNDIKPVVQLPDHTQQLSPEAKMIFDRLNSWNKRECDLIERPETRPRNVKTSGESNAFVPMMKRQLAELGVKVKWNADKQLYEVE